MDRLFPVLFLLLLLPAQWAFDRSLWRSGDPTMNVTTTAPIQCPEPALHRGGGEEIPLPYEDVIPLYSNELLRIPGCVPGTLRFAARGSHAFGEGPYLLVSFGPDLLYEGEITDPQRLSFRIDSSGWIGLAFVNDYYDPPEDRNLFLSELEFIPD